MVMYHRHNEVESRSLSGQYYQEKQSSRILLNVGGEVYETNIKTLERFPQTLLGNWKQRLLYYSSQSQLYFFDRSRLFFDAILFFYQSNGILQCPPELPLSLFEEECRFFQIPEETISRLRSPTIIGQKITKAKFYSLEEQFTLRLRIWNLLNSPESSWCAKIFAFFSILMITISVGATCLESLPSLQYDSEHMDDNPWNLLDLGLNVWFLIELILSVTCAPNLKIYFQRVMSWIDIIAVIPYFVTLVISAGHVSSFGFIRTVRLFRVFRLFVSISRQSAMLKKLAIILNGCIEDFKTIFICFNMIIVLGGSCIYFLEAGTEGNMFSDIPTSVYWGTITLTTVGYGDYIPLSIQGQIWATFYMFFGALTMCIPIISVITKLETLYKDDAPEEEKEEVWSVDYYE